MLSVVCSTVTPATHMASTRMAETAPPRKQMMSASMYPRRAAEATRMLLCAATHMDT